MMPKKLCENVAENAGDYDDDVCVEAEDLLKLN